MESSEWNLQSLSDVAVNVVVEIVRYDDVLVLDGAEDVLSFGSPVELEHRPLDLRDDAPVEPRMHRERLGRHFLRPGEHDELLALLRWKSVEAPRNSAAGRRRALDDRAIHLVVGAGVDRRHLVRRYASAGQAALQ